MINLSFSLRSINTGANEKRNGIVVKDDMICVLGLTGGFK